MIDLLNGVVVHAKQGVRSQYQAVQSSLTNSSHPIDIVKAFLSLHPFKTLYVADLNAIQGLTNTGQCHQQLLEEIHQTFPHLTIWIDAGISHEGKVKEWQKPYTKIILGSESFTNIEQYQLLTEKLDNPYTLSLDFSRQGYSGPHDLLQNTAHWSKTVIVMTLMQVGANLGSDMQTIKSILCSADEHLIYAAGGIRHLNDLLQLKQLNVHGALVASALHNQQLSSEDLAKLCA